MTWTKAYRNRRNAAARAQIGACPHPGKKPYPSRFEAEDAMHKTWRHVRPPGCPLPIRVYHCACGRWHMTSQALRERVAA